MTRFTITAWLAKHFDRKPEPPQLCADCPQPATTSIRHLDGVTHYCDACMERAALGIGA